MIDLTQMEAKLAESKDIFWARKVTFLAGFKVSMHLLPQDRTTELLFMLAARDVLADMRDHYPNRNQSELSHELMQDCDKLIEELANKADEELNP